MAGGGAVLHSKIARNSYATTLPPLDMVDHNRQIQGVLCVLQSG